jgi:hypothetical protein
MTILQQQIVTLNNEIDIFVDYVGAEPNRVLLKPFQPNKASSSSSSSAEPVGPYLIYISYPIISHGQTFK